MKNLTLPQVRQSDAPGTQHPIAIQAALDPDSIGEVFGHHPNTALPILEQTLIIEETWQIEPDGSILVEECAWLVTEVGDE